MRESCSSIEKIALSEHLKLVEVRCQKIAENVHKFVDILNAYGITSDIINIVEMDGWSKCKLDIEIQNACVTNYYISYLSYRKQWNDCVSWKWERSTPCKCLCCFDAQTKDFYSKHFSKLKNAS